jgi:hypothetical protein
VDAPTDVLSLSPHGVETPVGAKPEIPLISKEPFPIDLKDPFLGHIFIAPHYVLQNNPELKSEMVKYKRSILNLIFIFILKLIFIIEILVLLPLFITCFFFDIPF